MKAFNNCFYFHTYCKGITYIIFCTFTILLYAYLAECINAQIIKITAISPFSEMSKLF